jgi:hypothetical protein
VLHARVLPPQASVETQTARRRLGSTALVRLRATCVAARGGERPSFEGSDAVSLGEGAVAGVAWWVQAAGRADGEEGSTGRRSHTNVSTKCLWRQRGFKKRVEGGI